MSKVSGYGLNGLGDLLCISHVDRMIGALEIKRDDLISLVAECLSGCVADTIWVTSTGHDRNFG